MDIGLEALAIKQQFQAASDVEKEGRMAAEMEGVASMQRETDRKLELMKAISSQRARAGASGIDVGIGSPISVISNQLQEAERDTDRDKFNTKIAQQSAVYRSKLKSGELRGKAQKSLLQRSYDMGEFVLTGGASKSKPGSIK